MVISEFEIKKIEKAAELFLSKKRPPPHIRKDLDIGYKIEAQSVVIMEIRPDWQNNTIIREYPTAKATYVMKQNNWKVFWLRADLKWHSYEPTATVESIEDFFDLVEQDTYACFWG